MADIVTLGDVSTKDTGSGSQLKTGGRRQHNMPKKCVEMKIKGGMSRDAAVKACYGDVQSRIPSSKYGTVKPKRTKRTLGEKLNPFDAESKMKRKVKKHRRAKKKRMKREGY